MKKQANSEELPFLSDVINLDELHKGQANVIIAPCHSGKTTATKKIIDAYAHYPERALCLIDTAAGKQSLITHSGAVAYKKGWLDEIVSEEFWGSKDGTGFRTMTYHHFGWTLLKNPDFKRNIDVILCDEMHNLIRFVNIEKAKNKKEELIGTAQEVVACQTALQMLAQAASTPQSPLIVIITASVNAISKALDQYHVPVQYFNYYGKVHCDLTRNTVYYPSFDDILPKLQSGGRALIYTHTVSQMLDFAEKLSNGTKNICCLWSVHSSDHPMTQRQLDIRTTLLETKRIPPEIDILFINAAYETSINIENEDFSTVVIHSGSYDTRTQVRGRLRHDIDTMYLYDSDHENILEYFPECYYDRMLSSADVREIADKMNLKNSDGRQLKWPSINKLLQANGVVVNYTKNKSGQRCYMLHRPLIMQYETA